MWSILKKLFFIDAIKVNIYHCFHISMASFYNGNSNFSFRSSSESEDNGDTTDNENQISSYGSTAFRNLMDTSSHSTPQVIEDTEENVRSQTQDVFLNYMYQSYTIDTNRGELDEAPTPKELLNLSRNPLTYVYKIFIWF